jgi:hypothetical protein
LIAVFIQPIIFESTVRFLLAIKDKESPAGKLFGNDSFVCRQLLLPFLYAVKVSVAACNKSLSYTHLQLPLPKESLAKQQ